MKTPNPQPLPPRPEGRHALTLPSLSIFETPDSVAAGVADLIERRAAAAVAARGTFLLVLSGGSTPKLLYELLASEYVSRIDWPRVHIYFGDERRVSHDHPHSNAAMAQTALLARVPIPERNIHRIPTGGSPDQCAAAYERVIRDNCPPSRGNEGHTFDLVLLGMGSDGHTLSLFPGSPALDETNRWCVSAFAPENSPMRDRITLTFPPVLASRQRVLLVTGADKKLTLARVLQQDRTLPVVRTRPTHIFSDAAAWFPRRGTGVSDD